MQEELRFTMTLRDLCAVVPLGEKVQIHDMYMKPLTVGLLVDVVHDYDYLLDENVLSVRPRPDLQGVHSYLEIKLYTIKENER